MNDAQENITGILTERVTEIVCSQCGGNINVAGMPPFTNATCPECSNTMRIPARLGNFLLLDLIGMGGMGGVYIAQDVTLGRLVAIKIMLKSLGQDAQFIETFRREAQSVARLNHPNIAQIYSFGEESGQPYIVMELVSGSSFDKMIEAGEPMEQGLVMRIGLEIAQALQAASELGLIHGDIKPENILMDEKMNAKLVDFGLASFKDQAAANGVWGTPYYIAPEKLRRQKVDERSDIYSLGGTLFHALTGRPPFEGNTPMEVVAARLDHEAPSVSSLSPEIHPDVDRIIQRMMEQSLPRRYPNYKSLVSDLQKVVKLLGADKPVALPVSTKIVSKARFKNKSDMIMLGSKSGAIPGDGSTDPNTTTGHLQNVSARELDEYRKKAFEEASRPANKLDWKILAIVAVVLMVAGGGVGGGIYLKARHDNRARAEQRIRRTGEMKAQLPDLFARVQAVFGETLKQAAAVNDAAARLQALEKEVGDVFETVGAAAPVGETNPPPAAAESADGVALQELTDRHTSLSFDVQKVVKYSQDVARKAQEVEAAQQTATRLNDEARTQNDPDELESTVRSFEKHRSNLAALRDSFKVPPDGFVNGVKGLEGIRDALLALKKKRDASTQARLDDEARVRAEQTARELAATEQRKVAELEAGLAEAIKRFDFAAATTGLKGKQAEFSTPEGREQLQQALEKVEWMNKTQAFMIQTLKPGLRGGYVVRGTPVDIVEVNEKAIKLSTGKSVEWKDVSPARYAKLLDRCWVDRKSGIKESSELSLGAALLFRVQAAEVLSKTYAEKAREMTTIGKRVDKLLPPLPAGEKTADPEKDPEKDNRP